MFNYENQICDYCGKPFDKNSDVVVCPDCGTPHHRECWDKLGHCVNSDKHNSGFEWKPVLKENDPDAVKCPQCGSLMPKGTMFCENCGHALTAPKPVVSENNPQTIFDSIPNEDVRNRIEKELAGNIDGVSYKDIAVYVGPNAQYYIYKFKRMQDNPNYHPFNWTAFLFAPLWYLFRKMWKYAIAIAAVNFAMNIPSLILTAVQLGELSASSPLVFSGIETVASVMSVLVFIFDIALGFAAVPLYRKETVKNLKKIRDNAPTPDAYYREVMRQSGPSKVGLVLVTAVSMFYLFSLFSGLFMF